MVEDVLSMELTLDPNAVAQPDDADIALYLNFFFNISAGFDLRLKICPLRAERTIIKNLNYLLRRREMD